jgi:hypothetical protein
MNGPLIRVAMTGDRHGYVIAVMLAPDRYRGGECLVVGDVRRISADGEPEAWKAWLWPVAGGSVPVTQSCDAVESPNPVRLLDKLQKRADGESWWERGAS